jgi:predicted PurR-regulated permease PerM
MQLRHLNIYFFFFLFFAVGAAVFFIFTPFITAIVAAAILAALFKGVYERILRWTNDRKTVSALATCLFVILLVVTPLFLVLGLAVGEATDLYHTVGEQSAVENVVAKTEALVRDSAVFSVFLDPNTLNKETVISDIRQAGQNAVKLLQAAYQGVTNFVFWVFVMFFTLYYFLIDGERAIRYALRLSPLKDEHDRLLIRKFVSISRATLKGTLLVGVVQGILGGITFWIAGIPSPAIWGLIMILFSIIPVVGTAIIWVPAAIIMLLIGDIWQGVFIIAVGAGIISTVDNILRPKLVGKDTHMHPLVVFFATLGGISVFGLPGFIIGPIIVSLFLALSEIYSIEFQNQLKEYNSEAH